MNQTVSNTIREFYEQLKDKNVIHTGTEKRTAENLFFERYVELFQAYDFEKNKKILVELTDESTSQKDEKMMTRLCQGYISAMFQSELPEKKYISVLCMFGAFLRQSSCWKDFDSHKELYDGICGQIIGETKEKCIKEEGAFNYYIERLIGETGKSEDQLNELSYDFIGYIKKYFEDGRLKNKSHGNIPGTDKSGKKKKFGKGPNSNTEKESSEAGFPDFKGSAERKTKKDKFKPKIRIKKKLLIPSIAAIVLFFFVGVLIAVSDIIPDFIIRPHHQVKNDPTAWTLEVPTEKPEDDKTTAQTADSSSTEESTGNNAISEPNTEVQVQTGEWKDIRKWMETMTLEEKVMQMFIISPEVLVDNAVKEVIQAGDKTKNGLEKYPVGGVNFGKINLKDPKQTKEMLESIQEYSLDLSGIPLFLSVDEEGGTVTRVSQNRAFGVENVGNMRDVETSEEAFKHGKYIGDYLSDLGFNVNWAPVADVITNKNNTVVAKRSFGSKKEEVAEDVVAFLNGLSESNMIGCLKHFPGHGGTEEDSHEGAAVLESTLEQLKETELVPFQAGIDAGAQLVMIGHITLPNIVDEKTPATLSRMVVTNILREELGFKGVVVSDAMNMGAIVNNYTSGEAAVKAVQAGVDMILLPDNFKNAYNAILEAVKNGTISEERIDESVYRILLLKSESLDWNPEN